MSTEMPWEDHRGIEGSWRQDRDEPQLPQEPRDTHCQRQEA